ncbi:transcription factor E2F3 [Nematolebias whitei]|uniref:transcription factor E2F3 n=1 Tax=Nematolebias whitei TaxID=451745 RepID=UPI001896B2CC|nr:transcription factor E2F3 [Nematolebias whitei]
MSFHTSPECNAPNPPCALPRSDTSLFFLTRRFAEKLSLSVDGVLDLKLVSQELNLSRRRIYDITNVLEGIRLIKKTSKSHIQWLGRSLIDNTNKQLMALAEEEMKLDELIQSCTQQIRKLCEERHIHKYAYLTHTDVRSIQSLRDQTVIVIKAPAETNVQVPHPDESLRVHIRSINGPIEVFVLSESMESSDNTAANGVDDGTKDYVFSLAGVTDLFCA